MKKNFICCICGSLESGWGNNPESAAWKTEDGKVVFGKFKSEDRCCDLCNTRFVIPGRILALAKQRKSEDN